MSEQNQVRILIGGVSYPAAIVEQDCLPAGLVALRLLEDIGDPGSISRDEAEAFIRAGTMTFARRDQDSEYYVMAETNCSEWIE